MGKVARRAKRNRDDRGSSKNKNFSKFMQKLDLSRLLLALLVKSTSPRRRTPPLRQTPSATSPVSSGEPTPKGKARDYFYITAAGNIAAATRLYPLIPPIVTFPIIFSLNTINTTRIGTHAIKHAASFLGVVRLCLTPSITRSIWSVDDCILNKP